MFSLVSTVHITSSQSVFLQSSIALSQFIFSPQVTNLSLKVKVTLEQATMPIGGEEVWPYSFLNLSTRWGWVVNAMP
jgi:hypothetical protein